MSFLFGNTSERILKTCHIDLQKIARLALSRSCIDFKIVEGERSTAQQKIYFDAGKSKCDGITKLSKHNYSPSLAFDFCAHVKNKLKLSYEKNHLCYLAGVFCSCAKELLERDEITHELRWGGNWDGDGEIIFDQSFDDLCHVELIKRKTI